MKRIARNPRTLLKHNIKDLESSLLANKEEEHSMPQLLATQAITSSNEGKQL